MTRSRGNLLAWAFAQLVAIGVVGLTAIVWVPWLGARPIEEVPRPVAEKMPAGCRAVTVSHGSYACQPHGTIKEAPGIFLAYLSGTVAGWAFIFFTGLTGRGFPITLQRRPTGTGSN